MSLIRTFTHGILDSLPDPQILSCPQPECYEHTVASHEGDLGAVTPGTKFLRAQTSVSLRIEAGSTIPLENTGVLLGGGTLLAEVHQC